MKGLILCGGKGTRLRPITDSIPKPLIPIANRPLIFYTIDLLIKSGTSLYSSSSLNLLILFNFISE